MPVESSIHARSQGPRSGRAARRLGCMLEFGAVLAIGGSATAQVLGPAFVDAYTINDLGSAPGVPASLGGLLFAPGDPSVLFVGGAANTSNAALYAIVVTRSAGGSVIGFDCGPASYFQAANGVTGGIDGGLDVGPGAVTFYTTADDNQIGQIGASSVGPDRLIDLSALGVASTTGGLRFVPTGFAGATRLKIVSFTESRWYDATVSPDGKGTFDIAVSPGFVQLAGGPQGIAYIKGGNPGFADDSVLVSNRASGEVTAYAIDSNGDPNPDSARLFISGLVGAEGATIDPIAGDLFLSTFEGGNHVLRVSGFTTHHACPADLSRDGIVDGEDIGLLLAQWGTTAGSSADLNGDCAVDGADLGALLGQWGSCAP